MKNQEYRAYSSWASMIQRCSNPKRNSWERYGGRGITVCNEWKEFKNFLRDMGEKPDGFSIDRIDPNGNYVKENCRWISKSDQGKTTVACIEMKMCFSCGNTRGNRKGRCHKCNEYFRRNGIERPSVDNVVKHQYEEARKGECPRCNRKICWSNGKTIKGYCYSCYRSLQQIRLRGKK